MRVDKQNTLVQTITRLTQTPLTYISKFLPSALSTTIHVLIFLFITEFIKVLTISLLYAIWPNFIGLLGWAMVDLLQQFLATYIYILFIQVIFSWLIPTQPTPISYMVYTLTYRVLNVIKKFIPIIKGFDFSPLIAILLIQLTSTFLLNPLNNTLMQWALR
jgi:YggT family protein